MANLKSLDKLRLENYLEMKGGYVCNFTNRTFQEFVLELTGIDIYAENYSGSKANRLRAFWHKESNDTVAKLLGALVEYWKDSKKEPLYGYQIFNPSLYAECRSIVEKLRNDNDDLFDDKDALKPNSSDKNFRLLAQAIRESIDKDRPEEALDRLHTFVMKYVREICERHGISFEKDTPLHSLFGLYVKFLQTSHLIESKMSERILKSSISVLDAFNDVRNNQSFAHDNPILNHNESVLIFNDISNIVRFLESVERRIAETEKTKPKTEIAWHDIEYTDEEIEAAGDAWIQNQIDQARGK